MQARCRLIFELIEHLSPPDLAEEWDNCGIQAGDPDKTVERVLVALDMDEAVLSEARKKGANLVITHHPLILKGIRQIREDRQPGRLLSEIIRAGITVYSAHTNLDSAEQGVNEVLAGKLGLLDTRVLKSAGEKYLKLVVFVPVDSVEKVREALSGAGAGWIGNYSHCTFMLKGTGTFRPLEGTNPYIGKTGELEKVDEIRLETILPSRLSGKVISAMQAAHPYEEVAYDLYPLENRPLNKGLGRIGVLKDTMTLNEFTKRVKEVLNLEALRYGGPDDRPVKKVAVCSGSGGNFWPLALSGGADVFLTGDIGYHSARDMLASGICFIDAGHYGTERVVLEYLGDYLRERCQEKGFNIDIIVSSVNGEPFKFV
ncbi:MAG: Nif3-like dinuclear metal center hexameric protein [Bacillota bacterium]